MLFAIDHEMSVVSGPVVGPVLLGDDLAAVHDDDREGLAELGRLGERPVEDLVARDRLAALRGQRLRQRQARSRA